MTSAPKSARVLPGHSYRRPTKPRARYHQRSTRLDRAKPPQRLWGFHVFTKYIDTQASRNYYIKNKKEYRAICIHGIHEHDTSSFRNQNRLDCFMCFHATWIIRFSSDRNHHLPVLCAYGWGGDGSFPGGWVRVLLALCADPAGSHRVRARWHTAPVAAAQRLGAVVIIAGVAVVVNRLVCRQRASPGEMGSP